MAVANITNTTVNNSTGIASLISNPDFSVFSLLAIIVVAIAVVLIFVVRSVMPVTPFLYANARISARSTMLVSKRKIEELAEYKNLGELENSLRDTEYINELEKSLDFITSKSERQNKKKGKKILLKR